MTTNEVFEAIISEPKWYAGKFSSQYGSKLKRLHRSGKLSDVNYAGLFRLFGYELVKKEIEWKKN